MLGKKKNWLTCETATIWESSRTQETQLCSIWTHVVVNSLFQLIFIFPVFLGMVMYANELTTKEKQKLTEIKN